MIKQKAVTQDMLEMMWTSVSSDEDMRVEFYKVISLIGVDGADQLQFFVEKIIQDTSFQIKPPEIDLFVSVSRKMMQGDAKESLLTHQILDFLWQKLFGTEEDREQ